MHTATPAYTCWNTQLTPAEPKESTEFYITEHHVDESIIPYEETDDHPECFPTVNPPANLHIFQPGMEAQDIVDIARATRSGGGDPARRPDFVPKPQRAERALPELDGHRRPESIEGQPV